MYFGGILLIKHFNFYSFSLSATDTSYCPQHPLSGRYCYLASGAASLKEAVTYCRNHSGWLMAEPSGDVLVHLPEEYKFNQMWLAGTSLKWIWHNNSMFK